LRVFESYCAQPDAPLWLWCLRPSSRNPWEREKNGYLYLLTNKYNKVLDTGVTCDLTKRISEHKGHLVKGFTKKYHCDKLVYYEDCGGIEQAILREKQIKAGPRKKKTDLIKTLNPNWQDLSNQIYR